MFVSKFLPWDHVWFTVLPQQRGQQHAAQYHVNNLKKIMWTRNRHKLHIWFTYLKPNTPSQLSTQCLMLLARSYCSKQTESQTTLYLGLLVHWHQAIKPNGLNKLTPLTSKRTEDSLHLVQRECWIEFHVSVRKHHSLEVSVVCCLELNYNGSHETEHCKIHCSLSKTYELALTMSWKLIDGLCETSTFCVIDVLWFMQFS